MVDDQTYPATVGQLSLWRDLEKMPIERRWETNLPFVWDLPSGLSEDDVWAALGSLAMRHESLRTTYLVDAAGHLRQRLAADTPADALERVRQGTAGVAERAAMEEQKVRDAIDVTVDMPWRVWILTSDDGAPAHVFLVVHHVGADGMGVVLMERDFQAILAKTPLPAVGSPRAMALSQQSGDGARGLKAAERYWRRTIEAAPHRETAAVPAERLGSTLHTGIPVPMAHDGAGKMEISLASLLLAGYYRGLRTALGTSAVLMFPVTNNRFDPAVAEVVTTLVQWAPVVLDFDDAEPFEEMAKKIHWKAFNAMKHGVCDPDAIMAIRDEHEAMGPPVDPGFYYNPILAPPGFPSTDSLSPQAIEWYEPARTTGPGVYVIARGLTSIDIIVRANRPGFDKAALGACLASIQDALLGAIGMV